MMILSGVQHCACVCIGISLSSDLIRFLFLRVRRTTHSDLLLRRVFSWRREDRPISLRDEQKHEMRSDKHENGDNDGKVNEFPSENQ